MLECRDLLVHKFMKKEKIGISESFLSFFLVFKFYLILFFVCSFFPPLFVLMISLTTEFYRIWYYACFSVCTLKNCFLYISISSKLSRLLLIWRLNCLQWNLLLFMEFFSSCHCVIIGKICFYGESTYYIERT